MTPDPTPDPTSDPTPDPTSDPTPGPTSDPAPAPGLTEADLQPGAVIWVPAGAALYQRRPYRLRIEHVPPRYRDPAATRPGPHRYVVGHAQHPDGRPIRRRTRLHAYLDPAKCGLITPAPTTTNTPEGHAT